MGSFSLTDIMRHQYPGLFCKGIASDAIPPEITEGTRRVLFMPCLHDRSLLQVNSLNMQTLEARAKEINLSDIETATLKGLFQNQLMPDNEVMSALERADARFKEVAEYISSTQAQRLSLTSVGMIVGVVNVENVSGEKVDLSAWFSGGA